MPKAMDMAEMSRRMAAKKRRDYSKREMQREMDEAQMEGAMSKAKGEMRMELRSRPLRNKMMMRSLAMGEKAMMADERVQAMKRKRRRRMTIAEGR